MLEEGHQRNDAVTASDDLLASFGALSVDVLANILGFLLIKDIMCSRRINKKWKEAVRKTVVPPTDFVVDSLGKYNAVAVMTREMPNLQQITIRYLGIIRHKWSDGEDPNEERAAATANWTSHDIGIISNFGKLRILVIYEKLNGRYPFLFSSFPMLQKLSIGHCPNLKWDLEMLDGMPLLKELECTNNDRLTGNINSLRVLKDTLVKVTIHSYYVEGNFMDLADFPHLKELNLYATNVTGDIRDIGENDFSLLEYLRLPHGVYGGIDYEFRLISDGPGLIRTIHLIVKQRPALVAVLKSWYVVLSRDSPDWYASLDDDDSPPFRVMFAVAGSRVGYQWWTDFEPCEVNWLDPEPDIGSSGYGKYMEELQEIEDEVAISTYRGFHQPPTEEEYRERWFAQQEGHVALDNYDY